MKRLLSTLSLLTALTLPALAATPALYPATPVPLPPGADVWFTAFDNIEDEIVKSIESAKVEILTSQYVLTSPRIVRALVEAFKGRKVFVAVILEPRPNLREYQTPQYLRSVGIPVLVRNSNGTRGLNNHKFWVIDRSFILTGSYDCTVAAASWNDENLLKLKDAGMAVAFYNAWVEQATRCTPLP